MYSRNSISQRTLCFFHKKRINFKRNNYCGSLLKLVVELYNTIKIYTFCKFAMSIFMIKKIKINQSNYL